jgi:hypothetical protein
MTDKSELLPCPFCGAAAKATDEMFGSVIHCDHLHTCPLDGHEQLAAAVREWNARANHKSAPCAASQVDATPEDVGAVVDEPVGYMTQCLRGDRVGVVEQAEGPDSVVNLQYWTPAFPVYRHPQRQMVLPERICGKDAWRSGWNDCLDKIADLNK